MVLNVPLVFQIDERESSVSGLEELASTGGARGRVLEPSTPLCAVQVRRVAQDRTHGRFASDQRRQRGRVDISRHRTGCRHLLETNAQHQLAVHQRCRLPLLILAYLHSFAVLRASGIGVIAAPAEVVAYVFGDNSLRPNWDDQFSHSSMLEQIDDFTSTVCCFRLHTPVSHLLPRLLVLP